jgi:hypothetical protein
LPPDDLNSPVLTRGPAHNIDSRVDEVAVEAQFGREGVSNPTVSRREEEIVARRTLDAYRKDRPALFEIETPQDRSLGAFDVEAEVLNDVRCIMLS